MDVEANLKSKYLYKILLLILKGLPIIISFCYLFNTILSYFGYNIEVLSYLCGMSLFPWVFIYISTIVFRFCIYHRMFLYYILISDIINIIDYYIKIPISDFKLLMLHIIISGISLFLILYLYVNYYQKSAREDN